jgi:hypothetical protein
MPFTSILSTSNTMRSRGQSNYSAASPYQLTLPVLRSYRKSSWSYESFEPTLAHVLLSYSLIALWSRLFDLNPVELTLFHYAFLRSSCLSFCVLLSFALAGSRNRF